MPYSLAYTQQYDSFYSYQGDVGAFTFEALGPGGFVSTLKWAIEEWARGQGLDLLQLTIEDQEVGSVFGFSLASRYRVYILFHGSPFLWVPIIIVLLVVLGVSLYGFFSWKAEEVRFGPSKAYYDVANTVVERYSGTPEDVGKVLDSIQRAAPVPPEPSPGLLGEAGGLAKWAVVAIFAAAAVYAMGMLKRP